MASTLFNNLSLDMKIQSDQDVKIKSFLSWFNWGGGKQNEIAIKQLSQYSTKL